MMLSTKLSVVKHKAACTGHAPTSTPNSLGRGPLAHTLHLSCTPGCAGA